MLSIILRDCPKESLVSEIKIYCDTGADITFLKKYYACCTFFQFPYDSSDRPKRKPLELAMSSEARWEDANITWGESDFSWGDFSPSEIFNEILSIVGKTNRRDALHIDSAYKTGCHIFLTSDKGDIWVKKTDLEDLCKIKFFHVPSEKDMVIRFIEKFCL